MLTPVGFTARYICIVCTILCKNVEEKVNLDNPSGHKIQSGSGEIWCF